MYLYCWSVCVGYYCWFLWLICGFGFCWVYLWLEEVWIGVLVGCCDGCWYWVGMWFVVYGLMVFVVVIFGWYLWCLCLVVNLLLDCLMILVCVVVCGGCVLIFMIVNLLMEIFCGVDSWVKKGDFVFLWFVWDWYWIFGSIDCVVD